MRPARELGLLAARLLLALLFVIEGWLKIRNYAGTTEYMQAFGVPGWLLPAAIATELGGGLLIAVGFLARAASLALAAFCLATAAIFHNNLADSGEMIHFLKDLAIAGGFLLLAACGPGAWSVDGMRRTGHGDK